MSSPCVDEARDKAMRTRDSEWDRVATMWWQVQPASMYVCVSVCVCMLCNLSLGVETRVKSLSFWVYLSISQYISQSETDCLDEMEMSLLPSNHVAACEAMARWHFFLFFFGKFHTFSLIQMRVLSIRIGQTQACECLPNKAVCVGLYVHCQTILISYNYAKTNVCNTI